MAQSPLMLLVVPVLVAAVPLLFFGDSLRWWQAAGRLGAIGLGFAAWIDVLDNCAAACVEDDPLLLSGMWAASAALLAAGVAAVTARAVVHRRAP